MPKETHCAFCGTPFTKTEGWPRRCEGCGAMTFRNPLPVAVVVQPVRGENDAVGLLCIRRGIPPQKGFLALPGGYVDLGEDWRVAGAREVHEETGYTALDPASLESFDTLSNPEGDRILIFGQAPTIDAGALPPFSPTSETSERVVVYEPQELAFSLHTEVMRRFFEQQD